MSERIIEKNVVDIYKENMQSYAIALNRKQAVPEIRDGLKTVARRILDMMYEKGYSHNKGYVKCARVVGDTMGSRHPHGDCLNARTGILGIDGKDYTIEELYNSGIEYLYIMAVNSLGKVVPVKAHSFRIGQYTNKIYHIRFCNGSELSCTSNHPILLSNMTYIKAQNVKPGMRMFSHVLSNITDRPYIDKDLLQNIVSDFYNGPRPDGYVRHHIDENPRNNVPENIKLVTKEEHAMIHKSYYAGLDKGRESMFSEKGSLRIPTKKKNSELASIFNKDQGFRRFKHAITVLIQKGLEITEENYESLRGEIYNLPYIENLIKKGYGKSFEELVEIQLPSVGEIYQQTHVPMEPLIETVPEPRRNMIRYMPIFKAMDAVFDKYGTLNYQLYCSETCTNITESDFYEALNMYIDRRLIVSEVEIEELEAPVPMYDFTVDNYENMLIPMYGTSTEFVPMLCVHNSAIYEVIVNLSNWYSTKMPLIDGHGNFGNMQGKGAAAYRYTECRTTEFADECVLGDIYNSKDIVDWVDNYNNTDKEPEYLPCRLPLLLINGTFGIGIGMRSEVPTHNINEVIDATINVIKNPNAPVVLIPDHCMPCEIIDTDWKKICNAGLGSYRVRGIVDIETTKGGCPLLVIKSVPNNTTLFRVKSISGDEGIIARVNEMAKNGTLPQVTDTYSDAKGDSLRYCIQLKKGSDPYYVRDYIYKHTKLEDTFRVNFEALDIIEGLRFSYKSYIEFFIEFQITLKVRLYASLYQKAKTEWREKQLYIMVMESGEIENIQKKIRNMKSVDSEARNEFKEWIIKKFKVSDIEASFIMNMDQMKTAKGYLPIYKQKCAELEAAFTEYFTKMNNEDILKQEIIDDLLRFKKKYGTPRVCKVVKDTGVNIPQGEFKIVITENNYIKKIGVDDNVNIFRGDTPKFVMKVDNTENILLFDIYGKVFKLPIYKIALCDKNAQGTDLRLLIKNCTSPLVSIMYEPSIKKLSNRANKHFMVVVTANNCIKKLDLEDFLTVLPSGILYTKLNPEDYVQDIAIIPDNLDIILYSDKKALSFNMKEVPHYKRTALGVSAMNTKDTIDGLSIIYPDATYCVVITESGRINKFDIMGLKRSSRNKAGTSVIKLGKSDRIKSIYGVNDNNTIQVTHSNGVADIKVSDLKTGSSVSTGDKVIKGKVYKTKVLKESK